jgi:hypothetical protein
MSSFIIEHSSPEFIRLGECNSYGQMAIQNNVFELDDKYYYIKKIPERSEYIDKITPLLEFDELSEPGMYVYVIVSSASAKYPYEPNTPTLFYKEVLSNQEIQTKHNDLLYDICHMEIDSDNHRNKKTKIDDSEIGSKYKFQPDKMYFAGEFEYSIKNKKNIIEFNFLSGSYMVDHIDAMKPTKIQIDNCREIFETTLSSKKFDIDFTTKSLLLDNIKMTPTILNYFIQANAEIYVADKVAFQNINEIKKQINNSLKIEAQIEQEKRQLITNNKYSKTEEQKEQNQKKYEAKINELKKGIIDLSGEGPFKRIKSFIGGKKSKCKSRKINIRNRNNKKSKCKSRKKVLV